MSYLFQRPGSSNWWLKLQAPTNVTKSLGTSDKRRAEAIAARDIAAHKAALVAKRPHLEWGRWLEPGEHTVNGERVIASEREVIYLAPDGAFLRTEPNTRSRIVPPYPESSAIAVVRFVNSLDREPRPTVAKKNTDDALFDEYLKHAKLNPRFEREARATWEIYKHLTNGKPLAKATRQDGRMLAQHIIDSGNKSATAAKKIGWLRAACAFAIKDGLLSVNPFAEAVPQNGSDELRRKPLTDADMALCKKHLDTLSERDALLFRLLATTGARLGEAYHINGEQKEHGVRYVVIGSKTKASLRRVPLPKDLLPYLPKVIKGPLFTGSPKAASGRLNTFLDDCGLKDKAIVIHSLRHRAADRLRAAECPQDIRYALLGHEKKSIAEGYGEGFAVTTLKKWVDKIGFA